MKPFKKLVYIQFYPDVWLNAPELKTLDPDVKGFYIDLICQLHYCFPYGYCSELNALKAKKLQKQLNLRVNAVVIPEDKEEDNLWVDLVLNFSLQKQLSVAENLEAKLPKLLGYDKEQIAGWTRVLEEKRIVSRSSTGILYVRRMQKDFKRKVDAYLKGIKGGNPKLKKAKSRKNVPENEGHKPLKNNGLQNQLNPLVSGEGYPISSYSTYPINKGVGNRGLKGGNSEKKEPDFESGGDELPNPLQKVYESSWEELEQRGFFSKGLNQEIRREGFERWKEFVAFIQDGGYTGIWSAKPLGPRDFQILYFDKGFVREPWWKPVIEKLLASGLKPEHSLLFRIPEFMRYAQERVGKNKAPASLSAGNIDYNKQEKW